MDYKEEQDCELETLKAIYSEEELNVLSKNPWNFEIIVKSEADDAELQCVLNFTLPNTYPEVVPIIAFSNEGQLTSEQQKIILDALNEEAEANLEMQMIFSIVSTAQDKLQLFLEEMKEEVIKRQNEAEIEKLKVEEAKYKGTPVTVETFSAWRQKFLIEFEKQKTKLVDIGKGLTGRQMFERDASLSMSDARFLTELDETIDKLKDVEIDESLFQELGDVDDDG